NGPGEQNGVSLDQPPGTYYLSGSRADGVEQPGFTERGLPMSQRRGPSVLIGCLVLLLTPPAWGAPTDAEPRSRTDAYGDPLPEGALARLGTSRLFQGDKVRSLAFSPDGKILASAGDTEAIFLWDAVTGKLLSQLTGHRGSVYSVSFSP